MRHVNISPSGSSKSLDLFVARSLPPDSIWKGPVRYAGLYSSSVRRTRFTESHDSSRNEAEQRESEALLSLHSGPSPRRKGQGHETMGGVLQKQDLYAPAESSKRLESAAPSCGIAGKAKGPSTAADGRAFQPRSPQVDIDIGRVGGHEGTKAVRALRISSAVGSAK